MQRIVNAALAAGMLASLAINVTLWRREGSTDTRLRPNVAASFNPDINEPRAGAGAYIDPLASVIGDVRMGRRVMVAPFASVRGDEGQPIRIGSRTNIQDGVVIHALETVNNGEVNEKNLVEFNDRKYAVYIGDEVSLAHQSQVHGPALIGDRTFVGMQALVFKSEVGEGSVIEPGAKVIGVKVAPGHYVPAGAVITTQAQADALPVITEDYAYRSLNDGVIRVNTQLADGYLGNGRTDGGDEPAKSKPEPAKSKPEPAKAPEQAAVTQKQPAAPGGDHKAQAASPTPGPSVGATPRGFPTQPPAAPPAAGH